jgi:membrane protein
MRVRCECLRSESFASRRTKHAEGEPVGTFFKAIKQAAVDFQRDECMLTGAALSYYTIFSLPPLLVLVFMVAQSAGVHRNTIDTVVAKQLGIPTGQSQEEEGKSYLVAAAERTHDDSGGLLGQIVGFAILVFSATGVLGQLQLALNRAWDVTPDEEHGGIWNFAVKRLLSLGMIVVFALLLLVSLVLTTLIDEFTRWITGDVEGVVFVVTAVANAILSVLLAAVLFAAVFRVLPDVHLTWRQVWVGAVVTGVLFVVGKTLIAIYLQRSNIGSQWGAAAGSMIGVLVWVYYNSLLVLYGAEFTQAWTQLHGDWPKAENGAKATIDDAVIEERLVPGEKQGFHPSATAVGASPPPPGPHGETESPTENAAATRDHAASTAAVAAVESHPIPREALPMSNHERGLITAEDRVFFKLQMTNLTGNPEESLANVLKVLEETLQQCTQFGPDKIVGDHLGDLDDALQAYVEEFQDAELDFGELCDVIAEDVDRCRDLIGRHGAETRLVDLDGAPLTRELEPVDGKLVEGDELTVDT